MITVPNCAGSKRSYVRCVRHRLDLRGSAPFQSLYRPSSSPGAASAGFSPLPPPAPPVVILQRANASDWGNDRRSGAATAASQRLFSPTLGFGKFAAGPPAVAEPALNVIGLLGLVFITQGPSAHVKHPYVSCMQLALPDCFGRLSPPSANSVQAASDIAAATVRFATLRMPSPHPPRAF